MTDLKSLLDISEFRTGLSRRMKQPRFQEAIRKRLAQLDTPVPSEDEGTSGREEEPRKSARPSLNRLTSSRAGLRTLLQIEISDTIAHMKTELPPKPWHDTMRFVSFDLPKTGKEFMHWITLLAEGKEATAEASRSIKEAFPAMKKQPETDNFMKELILPFRSFFMAQIIIGVLRLKSSKQASKEKGGATTDDLSSSQRTKLEDEREVASIENATEHAARNMPQYAGQQHASHHAKDDDDVRTIESFLPSDITGLKRHITQMNKSGICTRYAQYHLAYMESGDGTEEETATATAPVDDSIWVAKMRPLAEGGLAHAQFDLGICLMALKLEVDGRKWLERAATLGHTRAMVELGQYHFAEALGISDVKDAKLRQTPDLPHVRKHAKEAVAWLEKSVDAPLWDAHSTKDQTEAKQLLARLDADVKKLIEYNKAKAYLAERSKKRRLWVLAIITLLVAVLAPFLYAFMMRISGHTNDDVGLVGDEFGSQPLDPDAPFASARAHW